MTIYELILKLQVDTFDKIKNDWERELQISLSIEKWERILQLVNTSSVCARHTLIQFKVVHRAHMSKDKLTRFYGHINPTCDRCNSEVASLTHMFWSCPLLEKYWKDIFDTISVVLGIDLQPHPITAIFGLPMLDSIHLSRSALRLIAFTTLMHQKIYFILNGKTLISNHTPLVL